jgi:hypothetical protein
VYQQCLTNLTKLGDWTGESRLQLPIIGNASLDPQANSCCTDQCQRIKSAAFSKTIPG